MQVDITGSAGSLEGWLAMPESVPGTGRPGLVIVPGFPTDSGGGANSFATLPDLADRVADHARMVTLAIAFRGLAGSQGHFSLDGWRRDLRSALEFIRTVDGVDGSVWLMGFGTGGALAIDVGATDGNIAGVVSVAAPADFQDWASRPRELLSHARRCGAISDPNYPPDFNRWAKELQGVSTAAGAERLGALGTPMMVLHGSNDDAVPALDARVIADAHGAADLRILEGARHHLRHDPRAVATAVGFLDRRGRPATSASR